MKSTMQWAIACLTMLWGVAMGQTQGVTRDEIVLGTHLDLSGPAAPVGSAGRNGMFMRVDEINAAGGIHGRKIRLVVEDTGFNPPRAILATQKLVNQDQIFALVGSLGTATSVAAMPIALRKNVPHLFPMGSTRDLYEPTHPLVYATLPPNSMEVETILPRLVKEKNATRVCILFQDDEFGKEIVRGAEAGLKSVGLELVSRSSHKRGDTDFSSQIQKFAADKCDFVVFGTLVRETIAGMVTARRIGFTPTFLSTTAPYSELTPRLGGAAVDGLYAPMRAAHPYADDRSSKEVQRWVAQFRAKYNEDPNVFHIIGYNVIDSFYRAAMKAGKDLTVENFIRAMDSLVIPPDIFGNPELSWSPTKRLGSPVFRLSQLQGGRWTVVKDYAEFR
jgi:branched-chain amino acid transport system substrate-binding protein